MDIYTLRKLSLAKAIEIISLISSDNTFDFSEQLELVKFRVKSEESIVTKCQKLNIEYNQVYDLIGIRFVLKDVKQCYLLLERMKRHPKFKIKEVRDYIKSPKDLDEYKALHVHVDYDGFLGEIQIMDIAMHKLDEKTHDDYKLGLLTIGNQ